MESFSCKKVFRIDQYFLGPINGSFNLLPKLAKYLALVSEINLEHTLALAASL